MIAFQLPPLPKPNQLLPECPNFSGLIWLFDLGSVLPYPRSFRETAERGATARHATSNCQLRRALVFSRLALLSFSFLRFLRIHVDPSKARHFFCGFYSRPSSASMRLVSSLLFFSSPHRRTASRPFKGGRRRLLFPAEKQKRTKCAFDRLFFSS